MSKTKAILLVLLAVVIAAAIAVGVVGCASKSKRPAAAVRLSLPIIADRPGQHHSLVRPAVLREISIRSRSRLISRKHWRG